MAGTRFIQGFIFSLATIFFSWPGAQTAEASCGSVTCFVVIGSQQQVSPKGLLTVNAFYNYTPQGTLLSGTNGVIPAVDLDNRQLILGHHQEIRTISQMYTLDLNYGVTDQFGIEVAIPYKRIKHQHIDGLGEVNGGAGDLTRFSDNGIGDIFINAKYNLLPTLRSMVVTSFGVYLPTGDHNQKTAGVGGSAETMEPTAQVGRGQVGLQGSIYQTYEIIPHRLNQFASASYRHTFRNNFGYQFGDQFDFGLGANLVTVPWLVLTNQFNYRYMVHDSFSGSLAQSLTPSDPGFPGEATVLDPNINNRAVPTTGSTFFAYTPGFQISLGELVKTSLTENTSLYFYSQIPVARDFNGNLAQGVSYVFGITKLFQVMKPS
ncbi:MAG: transporter [Nitrospirae bacterium]|nr:transporter [Nitrospirota bacterium]MBU6481696.1 transporter [Nitrospirota bacterium]MDE3048693.1 transporter [Nitrospirota bacterium]MDE3221712.1 transporter [Nitrospirota bacterium]